MKDVFKNLRIPVTRVGKMDKCFGAFRIRQSKFLRIFGDQFFSDFTPLNNRLILIFNKRNKKAI